MLFVVTQGYPECKVWDPKVCCVHFKFKTVLPVKYSCKKHPVPPPPRHTLEDALLWIRIEQLAIILRVNQRIPIFSVMFIWQLKIHCIFFACFLQITSWSTLSNFRYAHSIVYLIICNSDVLGHTRPDLFCFVFTWCCHVWYRFSSHPCWESSAPR